MAQLINRSKIRQLTLYPSKIIQAAVYFDEAINTYTLIEDPRHGLIALPKSHAYVGRNSPRVL